MSIIDGITNDYATYDYVGGIYGVKKNDYNNNQIVETN